MCNLSCLILLLGQLIDLEIVHFCSNGVIFGSKDGAAAAAISTGLLPDHPVSPATVLTHKRAPSQGGGGGGACPEPVRVLVGPTIALSKLRIE